MYYMWNRKTNDQSCTATLNFKHTAEEYIDFKTK